MFPDAECELTHSNEFELLIAVVLSAQATDALINKVTPDLFKKYQSPEDYLNVPLEELKMISDGSDSLEVKQKTFANFPKI